MMFSLFWSLQNEYREDNLLEERLDHGVHQERGKKPFKKISLALFNTNLALSDKQKQIF